MTHVAATCSMVNIILFYFTVVEKKPLHKKPVGYWKTSVLELKEGQSDGPAEQVAVILIGR